jgi:hypothetical protein
MARRPRVARQHLDRERRADRLPHHPGRRLVGHARFVLVRLQLGVKGELLPPSTAGMKQRRSRLKLTFIQAGACGISR